MRKKTQLTMLLVLVLLLLIACARTGADTAATEQAVQQTSIAQTVAAEQAIAQAVAATLTAVGATPANAPGSITPTPTRLVINESEPATPTAVATRLVIAESDVDGDDGNNFLRSSSRRNAGRVVLLPGFQPDAVTDPVRFQGRMALRVEVFDTRVGRQDGDGIAEVTFQLTNNDSGDTVYDSTEESAPYCLFGGSDPLCSTLVFAQTNFQWPNGESIYNGNYTAQINILTQAGDSAQWVWLFQIAGASDLGYGGNAGNDLGDFTGDWYTNFAQVTLQQSGDRVTGSYQRYGYSEALALYGTVSERTLTGYFGNNPADQVTFTLSADGDYLDGAWLYRPDGRWRQWCGARIGVGALPGGCGFSGDWYTISDYATANQPTATLQQIGPNVTGTFFNGSSQGTIEGDLGQGGEAPHHTLLGTYAINGSSDRFRWELLDFASQQFAGCWANAREVHAWCGWRAGEDEPTQCLPTTQCP